jgi:hypothetical protein
MPVPKSDIIAAILTFFLVSALLVTPIVLWATTIPKGTIKTSCSSDSDCNNNGSCVNNVCKCNSPYGGPFCTVLGNLKVASLAGGGIISCSQTPTVCKVDTDCSVCEADTKYSCQSISATQNAKGIAGNFCLPTRPNSNCLDGIGPGSIPGFYNWNGWADVETMQWNCECEFPNFYPKTIDGNTDACIKSADVCQYGNWVYPCLRDPKQPNTCLDDVPTTTCKTVSDCQGCGSNNVPTGTPPDQISAICGKNCSGGVCLPNCKFDTDCGAYPCINGSCIINSSLLMGSNPFEYGKCDCDQQVCSTDADCAGSCLEGFCVNQRVALSNTGVATCIRDTCAPGGAFTLFPYPPYTYGYCDCSSGYEAQGNTCVYTGNSPPTTFCAYGCGRGKCVASGKCTCDSGWNGNSICTQFSCDNIQGCGHGTCTGANICSCYPGYELDSNNSCTLLTCPTPCGAHGTCTLVQNVPKCVCDSGYTGDGCQTPIPITCPALNHGAISDPGGACVTHDNKCTDGAPLTCGYDSNAVACNTTSPPYTYFGNSATYAGGGGCYSCCQDGSTNSSVANLPQKLCSNGSPTSPEATPCKTSNDICNNTPVDLETCLQNNLYPYSCSNLCDAFNTLETYDYNTLCKNATAPTKPAYCS